MNDQDESKASAESTETKPAPDVQEGELQPRSVDEIRAVIKENPDILDEETLASVMMLSMKSHKGPLPAPEDFAAYEKTLPGASGRILSMAEKSQDNRIQQTQRSLDLQHDFQEKDFSEARRGQNFGLTVSLVTILGGIVLIALGHDWAGVGLVGATLAAIVVAFIKGRDRSRGK